MKAKERLQNTRFRNRIMNYIIFCPMPLRTSSIVKHDCGTAVAAFLSRTFGGPGILQFSPKAKNQNTMPCLRKLSSTKITMKTMKDMNFSAF